MRAKLAGVILLASVSALFAQPKIGEPEGYRTEDYRAPVPATLAGARVLTTAEAAAIWHAKAGVFVDVLPRPPKPKDLPVGTVWRDKPRFDIPGSVWLPDTGYGRLAPVNEDYLQRGVARASHDNKAALLVIYCQADCWMSWNAARRAIAMGYRDVIWYPAGTDGWSDAGLQLKETQPEPRPPE